MPMLPLSARAAARCDAARPPHDTRYAGTSGACSNAYGEPKATRITFEVRARTPLISASKAGGAPAVAVVELMFTYEPTTTMSSGVIDETNASMFGRLSSAFTYVAVGRRPRRRSSALNVVPAPRSVRRAYVTDRTRAAVPPGNGTS